MFYSTFDTHTIKKSDTTLTTDIIFNLSAFKSKSFFLISCKSKYTEKTGDINQVLEVHLKNAHYKI